MKTILTLIITLGCNHIYNHQTYVGTIRTSTNYINGWTYITLEPDNNTTLIDLCGYHPQLWKGEHVEIRISTPTYEDTCWTLDSYVRLGPDR